MIVPRPSVFRNEATLALLTSLWIMLRTSLHFAQCVSLPECFAFLNNLTFFLAR